MISLKDSYYNEVSKYDLLTKDEEISLFKIIRDSLNNESKAFAKDKARERLILCNQRLVIDCANKYMRSGIDYFDLIQEGNMGLIKAIDEFDLSKGCRLSTTAVLWISQSIRKLVSEDGTIRIPYNQNENIKKLNNAKMEYKNINGINPSVDELVLKTGFDYDRIKALESYKYKYRLLDSKLDDGRLILDIIPSNIKSPSEIKEEKERNKILFESIKKLPLYEQEALSLRFGLIDGKEWTFESIAKRIGKSRERTRQIINESILQLRKSISF